MPIRAGDQWPNQHDSSMPSNWAQFSPCGCRAMPRKINVTSTRLTKQNSRRKRQRDHCASWRRRRSRSVYFCDFERRQSLGCLPSSMRKAMLVAAIALVLGSTVTASDNARDWPYFEGPQQYLIGNLGEVLREQHALESCTQQQQEALQRFLKMGISYNAAALMAHSQYPCDSTDL